MKNDLTKLAGRVGLSAILLFGICFGAAMATFVLGHRSEAGWFGIPMLLCWLALVWANAALRAHAQGETK